MVVPDSPQFPLRWLLLPRSDQSWLHDSRWIPGGYRVLYNFARTGIYSGLRALEDKRLTGRNRIALLPAFIPHGVVWAFLEADYEVEYYPVNHDLTLPVERIQTIVNNTEPSVILIPHYFGFTDPNFDAILEVSRDNDVAVIENCARALFSCDAEGTLLGTSGDISIFSLYKVLPIPNGGLAVSKSFDLTEPSIRISERSELFRSTVKSLLALREKPTQLPTSMVNYFGSSTPRYHHPSNVWPKYGIGGISRHAIGKIDPEKIASIRRSRYRRLRVKLLSSDLLTVVTPSAPSKSVPYGVGAIVHGGDPRRRDLYSAITSAGLPAEIFSWPLGYRRDTPKQYPGSVALRTGLIVFPTHQQMSISDIDRLANIVEEFH